MQPFWIFSLNIPSYKNYLKIKEFFKAINIVQKYTFTEGRSYFDIKIDKKNILPFGKQKCIVKVILHHSVIGNKLVGLDVINKQLDAILDPLINNDLIEDFNAIYTPSDWINKMNQHNKNLIMTFVKDNAKSSIESMLKEKNIDPMSEEAKELVHSFIEEQKISMYNDTVRLFKEGDEHMEDFIKSDLISKESKVNELQDMIDYFADKDEFENCILLNKVLERVIEES